MSKFAIMSFKQQKKKYGGKIRERPYSFKLTKGVRSDLDCSRPAANRSGFPTDPHKTGGLLYQTLQG